MEKLRSSNTLLLVAWGQLAPAKIAATAQGQELKGHCSFHCLRSSMHRVFSASRLLKMARMLCCGCFWHLEESSCGLASQT